MEVVTKMDLSSPVVDKLLLRIESLTEIYKDESKEVKTMLKRCENLRTRILNTIEEAEYQGLNKGSAARLEDKLNRSYSFELLKIGN